MKQVAPQIYQEKMYSGTEHMRWSYVYLVHGSPRSLLIDTGYSNEESKATMEAMLQSLGIAPETLDVFVTHNHPDHAGLAQFLSDQGASIYMNEQERETSALLCTYYGCERSVSLERLHGFGFSPAQANRILERAFLPDYHYHDYNWRDFPIHNGAVGQHFVCGTYDFEVISLAGHTKHQLGLAERTHKWLFAGDTISRNEVLILSAMAPGDHLLDRQMETLDTLNREFSDYWVVSGHCNPFHGTEKSIANTKRYFAHITDRIAQLVSSEGTPLSLSQIVERLFRYKEGRMVEEESLKLHFRISNTLVCLECLTQQGVLFQTTHEGVTLWSPKNK